MKKRNNQTAKIVQRGGLMIEALAMLGLISVVTPTMYKKAAERTMEVEDINTASTIRTYMNAADAYIANNYGSLMDTYFSEVQEVQDPNYPDDETKKITIRVPKADGTTINLAANDAGFTKYLPYGFNPSASLYDYNTPKIRIVKNGTNLTAFVLFPRKAVADVGQERTTRIASLIGSAGGYMPNDSTARGVGGIWQLQNIGAENGVFDAADFTEADAKQYSLVTTSSRSLGEANGGVMDNDKYLQRTYENGQEWRNTMHADLYMGNHMTGETQAIVQDKRARNSIRDVKSLIIGSETANETEGGADDTLYGLYIAGDGGSTYTSAYIGGSLRALEEQFAVDVDDDNEPSLNFGIIDDSGYNLQIARNGDIYDEGHSGVLFNQFSTESDNMVGIARDDEPAHVGDSNYLLQITRVSDADYIHLINDSTFKISEPNSESNVTRGISMYGGTFNAFYDESGSPRISMFHTLTANYVDEPDNASDAKTASTGNPGIDNAGNDSLGNEIDLAYTNDNPSFGVDIGSNVRVQGVMTAGQVDTQHLRSSTFETGSENIDDAYKWLDVDSSGVRIRNPNGRGALRPGENSQNDQIGYGTSVMVDAHKVALRAGASDIDDAILRSTHPTQLILQDGSIEDSQFGDMTLLSRNLKMKLGGGTTNREFVISNRDEDAETHGYDNKDYRVLMKGGWLDLQNSGFHVSKINGTKNTTIFAVGQPGGNFESSNVFDNISEDVMTDDDDYATATHGPAIFTDYNPEADYNAGPMDYIKYMSVGEYDKDAGVNIIATGKTKDDYVKNVLVIDQTKDYDADETDLPRDGAYGSNFVEGGDQIDRGTVYIRKGMIEVITDENSSTVSKSYSALSGSGIVRASRFVANNQPVSYGGISFNGYEVPQQLKEERYILFNNSSLGGQYDYYMVNPAYTSVMNDIKLTTRGGARLSDILPDFINKGIYIANNTYDEDSFDTDDFKNWNNYGTTTASKPYASPYLGSVPAPQCPPGYGKVITVHPISFNIAQAGSLEYDSTRDRFRAQEGNIGPADYAPAMSDTGANNTTGVTNVGPNLNKYTPQYNRLKVGSGEKNEKPEISMDMDDGATHNYEVSSLKNFDVVNDSGNVVYVLSADSAAASKPLMFQQSTYLKTKVEPLCEGAKDTNGRCADGVYTSGWAALMGFIYPYTYYGKVIDSLTNKEKLYLASTTSTSWYWNIFPVLKNSLEATATVYCYFDRKNTVRGDYDSTSNFDSYDYLNTPATSYEPQNSSYRQRLNDPTLKYNELW